jgi:cation:H+ antiporter
MLISLIFFIAGLAALILGANFLVDGASSLAKRRGVTELVIGLTVVAFGTSMPELVVNLFASFHHQSDLALGNILGSNLFNILFILGMAGLISPLQVHVSTVWREIPFSFFITLIFLLLANDILVSGKKTDSISRPDGFILIFLFMVFLIYAFVISKLNIPDQSDIRIFSIFKTTTRIASGFLFLFLGGQMVVDHAVNLARQLHVSEKLIALTIVAGGTSLPELMTSIVAAKKGRSDIAIGNVIGSNIFNLLFILGISAIICPLTYQPVFNLDSLVLVFATLLLFVTMFTGKQKKLDRWEALVLLVIYAGYFMAILNRK